MMSTVKVLVLNAVGDFDGPRPTPVCMARDPDADARMPLALAPKPGGYKGTICTLDDR